MNFIEQCSGLVSAYCTTAVHFERALVEGASAVQLSVHSCDGATNIAERWCVLVHHWEVLLIQLRFSRVNSCTVHGIVTVQCAVVMAHVVQPEPLETADYFAGFSKLIGCVGPGVCV